MSRAVTFVVLPRAMLVFPHLGVTNEEEEKKGNCGQTCIN